MKVLVQYSGGIGSWGAAKRAIKKYGKNNVVLIFADTLIEDQDLYRFIEDTVQEMGCEFISISDGRTPWEVFKDERFIGNSRIDPCSKILKRKLLRKHITDNYDPDNSLVCIGIDWSEEHRLKRAEPLHKPWKLYAPLCEPPYITKTDLINELNCLGIKEPRLYNLGFPHNNCGGFCVKAGQAQFKMLYKNFPDRYMEHEEKEKELRDYLKKDVSILKEQKKGMKYPLTLKTLRERIEKDQEIDEFDFGGCGCAIE